MSYGVSSDEVAEDYRRALEDLTMNSRYEISNLTVIAKENTEHAMAISEALKDHILSIAPMKKLPAFYVLDSVVKNVGTPYTLFFGRTLYNTFMQSYAMVDNNVRRKMEEMLKTWKEPVPGSIDTRPVFPVEVTRPIENALIKARTSALQAQHEYTRSQQQQQQGRRLVPQPAPYRNTPTPPGMVRQSQFPQADRPTSFASGPQNPQQHTETPAYGRPVYSQPQAYQPSPAATPSWQPPTQPPGVKTQDDSLETLNRDISNLIASSKAEFAKNPFDGSMQTRLKALLDLQTVLASQRLPVDQLSLIRNQVTALAAPKTQSTPALVSASAPVVVSQPQPKVAQPSLASILGANPNALAALLAKSSAAQQVPTPPAPQPVHPVRSPQPQFSLPSMLSTSSGASGAGDPTSLLERLRAAGMLKNPPAAAGPPPQVLPPGVLPPPLPFLNPNFRSSTPLSEIKNDVQLKSASLKVARPHLISSLYDRLGQPCSQCGRRFHADAAGKKKKADHMDWHFKVHQRLAEAERRGQQRSWDWIRSRESDEDLITNTDGNTTTSGTEATKSKSADFHYVPVPYDSTSTNNVCLICQEKFEQTYLRDSEEWVWIDTIKVGERVYHYSCYQEAKKDEGGPSTSYRATPEPILGKRKNDDEHIVVRTKIKTEPVG